MHFLGNRVMHLQLHVKDGLIVTVNCDAIAVNYECVHVGGTECATSLPSNAWMVYVMSTSLIEISGDLASEFNEPSRCFLLPTQARPLTVPYLSPLEH
jgi:hypothetical protein